MNTGNLPTGAASDPRAPYNEPESKHCPKCDEPMIVTYYRGVLYYECDFCWYTEDDEPEPEIN